jgi:hypothetical protein
MALLWPRMEMLNMSKSRYPGITTLSDGRKRIRLRAVDPRTGRMKEVDRIVEGTVQEAASFRTELQKQIKNDVRGDVQVPGSAITRPRGCPSRIVRLKASPSSWYAGVLDTYVLPYLGDFFVDRITESDIRGWQARLARTKSAATVNGALVMLRMVVEDAVEEFDLPKNPSRRVLRLTVRRPTDEEPNLLTGPDLGCVLTWFARHEPDYHPLAATQGEAGGGVQDPPPTGSGQPSGGSGGGSNRPAHLTRTRENYNPSNSLSAVEKT